MYHHDHRVRSPVDTLSDGRLQHVVMPGDSLVRRIFHQQDSLISDVSFPSISDTTHRAIEGQLSTAADTVSAVWQSIYNERTLQALQDSLPVAAWSDKVRKQEVSEASLLQLVNDRFSAVPTPQADMPVLSTLQLKQDALAALTPLTGQVLDSTYADLIDSLRQVSLAEQRLVLEERGLTAISGVTSVVPRQTVWDKTYFEGLIGLGNSEQYVLQLAPALGYHVLGDASLGLGPLLEVTKNDAGHHLTTLGIRPFYKQAFLQRRAYVQVAYQWRPGQQRESQQALPASSWQGGGGVLLPISTVVAVNLAVMYQLNPGNVAEAQSPWIVRIGISTIKRVKE